MSKVQAGYIGDRLTHLLQMTYNADKRAPFLTTVPGYHLHIQSFTIGNSLYIAS